MSQPQCPLCRSKHVVKNADGDFICTNCKAMFDPRPEEGGTYYTDPTRRLELEDEARARKLNKIGGRRR